MGEGDEAGASTSLGLTNGRDKYEWNWSRTPLHSIGLELTSGKTGGAVMWKPTLTHLGRGY